MSSSKSQSRPGIPLLKIAIRYEQDIVTARQKTRRLSQLLGFDSQDQARLSTAVSELGRNVFQYASTGTIEFFLADCSPQTFFIRVSDSGPGIANLEDIKNGLYVSKSGMGIGLMGSKKLMDHFDIATSNAGTSVLIGKDFDRRTARVTKDDLSVIAEKLVSRFAENPFEEIQNQNRDLLNTLEELRASREQLANLNAELAETNRGVVALYAELDEKAASLQRANEVKTSFLSNMTHEFRTPLSSVISLTRLLLSRVDGELTPEQVKQVNYIRSSGEGLLELVNDLLDLAKVEAGKVSVNTLPFMVDEVLSGVRGMFRPILNQTPEIEFETEVRGETFELLTDQAKVSQILRNLVSNAIKYTEHGRILLSAYLTSDDLVHFEVKDSGIGIDSGHLELIFEDFSQVESKLQKKNKGTGLGLPLSRKIARLLGGDIRVESVLGQGSVFYVEFPRQYAGLAEAVLVSHSTPAASKELSKPAPNAPDVSGQFRVLLIDDNEPSRYLLRSMLREEIAATVLEAANGRSGLELIRTWHPDLVFLDLAMPEMSGVEVLKEMRKVSAYDDIPVIINSSQVLLTTDQEFLSEKAAAVLSKDRPDEAEARKALRMALNKAGFDYKTDK